MTNRRRAGEDRPDPPDRAGAPTRDGESRFASLARHAADMVSVVDADGIIRFANPATERQLGYRPEEVVGTRVERWLHPDDVAPMRAALARRAARPARPPAPIALRLRHRDGSWRWLESATTGLLADGGVEGFVVSSRDVTERVEAEAALRRSEERFRSLVRHVSDIILLLDADGAIRYESPAVEHVLGYLPEEVVGADAFALIHRDDAERVRRFFDEVRRRPGVSAPIAFRSRHRDGSWRWLEAVGDNRLADPTVGGVVVTCRDITERLRAEEEVRRLNAELERRVEERTAELAAVGRENLALLERERAARAEAEAARRSFAVLAEAGALFASELDLDATLENVARAALPAFADGATVDLVEGVGEVRHVAVAHVDPGKEATLRALQERFPFHLAGPETLRPTLWRGEPVLYRDITDAQLALVARNGEHLRLLRALAPCALLILPLAMRGRLLGALSFLTTEAGRQLDPEDVARAQLLGRRAALAIENARLYREAQRALAEAQAALATRDEFLSIASHELLTPVTALKGQLQLADRRLGRGAVEQVPELLRHAEGQVDRLTRLVKTLLDVARIGAGDFPIERREVALAPMLARVVELERAADASHARIQFVTLDASPVILGDADRLELVFVNLVENARKYSPAVAPIEVRLAATDEEATVSVRDEGVGIPPEEQAHIFDRFRRATAVDPGVAGMGLGLYIVNEIVRAHGGRIEVASKPGRGSTFSVTLPRLAPPPGARRRAPVAGAS